MQYSWWGKKKGVPQRFDAGLSAVVAGSVGRRTLPIDGGLIIHHPVMAGPGSDGARTETLKWRPSVLRKGPPKPPMTPKVEDGGTYQCMYLYPVCIKRLYPCKAQCFSPSQDSVCLGRDAGCRREGSRKTRPVLGSMQSSMQNPRLPDASSDYCPCGLQVLRQA